MLGLDCLGARVGAEKSNYVAMKQWMQETVVVWTEVMWRRSMIVHFEHEVNRAL